MEFLYLKATHIIFVVTWFAGLFYLPRLMVYAAEASREQNEIARKILLKQFGVMQRRLLYGITWPSAIITLLLGTRMLMIYPISSWLVLKLVLVFLVFLYHLSLDRLYRQQQKGNFRFTGQQLRAWNEVPTVLLFGIVFLVVLKNTMGLWYGLAGLAALVVLLMAGIRLYKRLRKESQS